MTQDNGDQTIGRRRLLRRAGTVAAGVAGAGVVSAVAASPAEAASGSFDSASLSTPAVTVTNTATASEDGFVAAGPQLAFTPNGEIISATAPVGSLSMDTDGFIWVRDTGTGSNATINFLHTTANSNLTVPIAPVRVLDTATAAGRASVLNPANINAGGQIIAGRWIHVDISSLVFFGFAVIGAAQVVTPAAAGYLTIVPYGSVDYNAPVTTSNVNYAQGVTIANTVFTGLGGDLDPNTTLPTDVISIYAKTAVRVIFDVGGFVVDSYGRVGASSTAAASLKAEAKKSLAFAEKRRQQIAKNPPRA